MSLIAATAAITLGLTRPNVDQQELECLAKNIYHEARGEVVEGQIAVAHVTLNRVEHKNWPNTICEVVYEPYQFSWTHLIADHTPTDDKAWHQAQVIARDVMIGNTEDPSAGATFYHASYVNPSWAKQMDISRVIGLHIFYTWDGTWD